MRKSEKEMEREKEREREEESERRRRQRHRGIAQSGENLNNFAPLMSAQYPKNWLLHRVK